jgi:hypothetical protein
MDRFRVCVALVAFGVLPAFCPPAAEGAAKLGISVFGGYESYSMSDVNDAIEDGNTLLGTSVDEVSSGIAFGAGVKMRTAGPVVLSFDYQRLNASASGSGDDGTFGYDVEYNLPANALVLGATYLFPSASKTRFGINGGIGYYMADGSLDATVTELSSGISASDETQISGNGVGFHGAGTMDLMLSPVVHLDATLGYRIAKSGDVEFEYSDGTTETFADEEIDWSGFMSQVGFTFYFGSE